MTELTKLKEMLADLKSRIDAFEKGVSRDFEKVTIDGVDYYDTTKELSYQECLDLAANHGLRVLERWELCKLYDESEEFRKSLSEKWYWSASVYSGSRGSAWQFYGDDGSVDSSSRGYTYAARCVLEATT
jgi:hypothetical protein